MIWFFLLIIILFIFPNARKRFFSGMKSHLQTGSTNKKGRPYYARKKGLWL